MSTALLSSHHEGGASPWPTLGVKAHEHFTHVKKMRNIFGQ